MVQLDIQVVGAQQSVQQINQVSGAEQHLISMNETLDAILLQVFQGFQRISTGANTTTAALGRTTTTTSSTTSSLQTLASIMSTVVGMGAIKQVYDFAKTWLTVGAAAEKTANQFKALEMIRPGTDLSGIEQVSRGLVTQKDLIQSINKAAFFGFDLSKKQLDELVKLSAKTAVAMGEDTKFMFDSIVTGVARESALVLDNLGVIVKMEDVYGKAAQALGKTTEEMTKSEKQTALLNTVIEELNKKTADIDLDKMAVKMQSSLKKYEEGFSKFFGSVATNVWEVSESFGERLADVGQKTENLGMTYEELVKKQNKANEEAMAARPVYLKLAEAVQTLNTAEISRLYSLTALQGQQSEWFREKIKAGFDWVNKIMPKAMVFTDKEVEKLTKEMELEKKLARERKKAQKEVEENWKWSVANADIGIEGEVLSGSKLLDTMQLQQQNEVNLAAQHFKDLADIEFELDQMVAETRAQNNELKLAQLAEFYREQEQMAEASYSIMEAFGRSTMDAILTGQMEKIPLILANQSYQTGMELFWDGVKTLWMGNAKNALFPGLGADAVGVGLTEMAIGGAMAGAGAVGAQALGGASGGGGSGSQERMRQEQMTMNIITEVSLYGSKKEAQRELNKVMGS